MGHAEFAAMMDEFGRSHAGHAVETAQFLAHAEKASNSKPLKDFFGHWLDQAGLPDDPDVGTWAVDSFEWEPEKALIVYGTVKDIHANGEAARKLQRAIATRWSNVIVPIKADTELTEDDWEGHHVLLVGRPASNSAVDRAARNLPVRLRPVVVHDQGRDLCPPRDRGHRLGREPAQPSVRGRPLRRPGSRVDLALRGTTREPEWSPRRGRPAPGGSLAPRPRRHPGREEVWSCPALRESG